jgi:hypothetical protein
MAVGRSRDISFSFLWGDTRGDSREDAWRDFKNPFKKIMLSLSIYSHVFSADIGRSSINDRRS